MKYLRMNDLLSWPKALPSCSLARVPGWRRVPQVLLSLLLQSLVQWYLRGWHRPSPQALRRYGNQ
jgi:hypothetical protein